MAKLWEKGYELDALIERFTVGRDRMLDERLVVADALGSMAHARMLASIGVLSEVESQRLCTELSSIIAETEAEAADTASAARRAEAMVGFTITPEDEDVHSAIERRLTEALGDVGKRIHAGRSRNDQVATALRIHARERLLTIGSALVELVEALVALADRESQTPVAGRTHLQPAMLSSVGLWAAAHAEELADNLALLSAALDQTDRCPLGSAASYGVPLPLDREMTSRLLGFREPHHNVLATANARGKLESVILTALDQIGLSLSRFAQDVIIFTLPEFGYMRLPAALCSGSSIMPQKRNPDAMELIRGKSATLSSYADRARNTVRSAPSGYNRDVQETKEALLAGLDEAAQMISVAHLTVQRLEVDRGRCKAGIDASLFATDEALKRVRNGMSFRDAYREVAQKVEQSEMPSDLAVALAERSSTGAPGNLDLDYLSRWAAHSRRSLELRHAHVGSALASLAGRPVSP